MGLRLALHIRLPLPVANLRHVLAEGRDVLPMLQQLVVQALLEVRGLGAKLRQAVDHVAGQVKAVQVVQDRHVERRGDRAFFLVAADVNVLAIGAPIHKFVFTCYNLTILQMHFGSRRWNKQ